MKQREIEYETALLMKEKGIVIFSDRFFCNYGLCSVGMNEQSLVTEHGQVHYNLNGDFGEGDRIYAPTQSLLQKYLREKLKTDITVITDWINGNRFYYVAFSFINKHNELDVWFAKDDSNNKVLFDDYEIALEKGLYNALLRIN
jgi:hypothetical protein